MENNNKGQLFVISGPSGVGKGTLVHLLLVKHPELVLSVSSTTRKPRSGEVNGKHYWFIDKEEFKSKIDKGNFLEWAEFSDNYYGTEAEFVNKNIEQGKKVLLEIDVKGAIIIKEKVKNAKLIFISPPSLDELKKRLFKRRTDSEEEINKRLDIVKSELTLKEKFNYVLVNKFLSQSYSDLEKIIYGFEG